MSVKYSIEIPDNCSADFCKILTDEFNAVENPEILKELFEQHSQHLN